MNSVVPSNHLRGLLTWIAVYPTITLLNIALHPVLERLPLMLQTLLLSLCLVPLLNYVLMPQLLQWYARRQQRGT